MQVKRAGLLTKIVVLALLIYMATALLDLRGKLQDYRAEQAALSAQVAQVQQENAELSHAVEHKDDPDVLEQVARDKGFVYAQERVFVDPTN
ncbi:MAG: septum formation initiator family protein [Oscillospiraceae bacterium]|nr:septum formation initiator family protein [Oscillospiraceae bacterium]